MTDSVDGDYAWRYLLARHVQEESLGLFREISDAILGYSEKISQRPIIQSARLIVLCSLFMFCPISTGNKKSSRVLVEGSTVVREPTAVAPSRLGLACPPHYGGTTYVTLQHAHCSISNMGSIMGPCWASKEPRFTRRYRCACCR